MNLYFYKVSEDESKVIYWIVAVYWNKKHLEAKAFCIYDKIIEEISFVPEKTDPYFFGNPNEPVMIEAHLKNLQNRKKVFPERDSIITS